MRLAGCLVAVMLVGLEGCADLPELTYETDHLRIGSDFGQICEGTLREMEDHFLLVEDVMGIDVADPVELYLYDELPDGLCTDGVAGCVDRQSRRVYTETSGIRHEIAHAVTMELGAADELFSEGIAQALNGRPSRFGPGLPSTMTGGEPADVDYDSAAHFMRWLLEGNGPSPIRELLEESSFRRGSSHAEKSFDKAMSMSLASAESDFIASAPELFPGFETCSYPEEDLPSDPGQSLEVMLEFDCGSEETRGADRMSRTLIVVVQEPGEYVLELEDSAEVLIRYCHDDVILEGQSIPIGGRPPIGDSLGEDGTLGGVWLPAGVRTLEFFQSGRFRVDVRISGVETTLKSFRLHAKVGPTSP